MNAYVIVPVIIVVVCLIIFLVMRNQKDLNAFEEDQNNAFKQNRDDASDDFSDTPTH